MLVAMRTVHVSMLNFLVGGGAHINDLDLKAQCLARHRMVAVEHDLITFDFDDRKDQGVAIIASPFQLPSHFYTWGKLRFGNGLQQPLVAQTKCVLRRQFDRGLKPLLLAFQR